MSIFFDPGTMAEIKAKYENSLYLPKFVWWVIGILIIAIIVILSWLHYLPS